MLKLEHVTKYYDDFRAVHDLSFEIEEGEIFGLLGVNGAGKTTTFRMIMGLLDITEGKITSPLVFRLLTQSVSSMSYASMKRSFQSVRMGTW